MKSINIPLALIMIEGLISTLETRSEIGIKVAELQALKKLLGGAVTVGTSTGRLNSTEPHWIDAPQASLGGKSAREGYVTNPVYAPVQPALRAAPMGLFPTMESLQEVIDLANSQLPVKTPNVMLGLMMSYHNTLLSQVQLCKGE